MDSFFKAAVCDLDKLLDEFEQNTGELDCYRIAVNQCDSKHHSVSSESDYLQPESLVSKAQEYVSGCTTSEEFSLASQTTATRGDIELNSSVQNEKNVTGLDLLSTVDGGASDESQPLSLGRCSIPVCDLISDTGNLIHETDSHEDIQKLQPGDFQCNEDSLIGFESSLEPATVFSVSVGFGDVSSKEQQRSGHSTLQGSEHVAAEELHQLDFKTHSHGIAKLSDSCGSQNGIETLERNQVLNQLEQIKGLNAISAFVTSQTPYAFSSKDDATLEKLPSESLKDDSLCCVTSQEAPEESVNENVDSKDEVSAESLPSELPKSSELNKNSLKLSEKCVLPDSSPQIEDMVVLDKIKCSEDNMWSPEHTNELLHSVSASRVTEDIQTSLSCFPLAVSMCSSLVVTEDKNGHTPQNERADSSDIVTMHAGNLKNGFPNKELCGKMVPSEQEEYRNQMNQRFVEETITIDGEKVESNDKISKDDSPQIHVASVFPAAESKIDWCGDDIQIVDNHNKSIICPVLADLTIEEDFIECDSLISDAELDAFLSGQCLQPNNSKHFGEDVADLPGSDAYQVNLVNIDNLDLKKISDSRTEAKLEETGENSSINRTCRIADTEYKLESPPEKNTYPIQEEASNHVAETSIEVPVPALNHQNVHIGGARPKQLLNLSQRTVGERELSKPNMPRTEFQEVDSIPSKGSLSETKTRTDTSTKHSQLDTENYLEKELPTSIEPVKASLVLGQKQPAWVPDSEAPNCMKCEVKFTFTKRRHHCRACGKVFCGACCNQKCKLQYAEKEVRVCIECHQSINKAQAFERMMSPTGPIPNSSISSECCSAVPPLQEVQTPGTPNSSPSVLLPISVLKQPGADGLCSREQRRVWFADGILPNGEVADTTKLSSGVKRSSQDLSPVSPDLPEVANPVDDICVKPEDDVHITAETEKLHCSLHVALDDDQLPTIGKIEMLHDPDSVIPAADELPFITNIEKSPSLDTANQTNEDSPLSPSDYRMLCGIENTVSKEFSLIPDDGLPPLLLATGERGKGPLVEEHPSHQQVTLLLAEGGPNPLTFILNANLLVNIKLVSYSSEKCWYFSTNGLHGLGQAEIIIVLLCLPNEDAVPKEIFKLFVDIYKEAVKGKYIGNLEIFTFTESFLGSKDHGGFLFVTPTFQKLDGLLLPKNPFLCGILIQKLEIPWAKVFPIRLMLRLGAEYRAYPTPITSIRHRKPLFGEIGHTIMNLLVDLRNYQYTLHTIDNLLIHMEMGKSCIKIPLRKYNEVMKVVNSSNEHVISIGASFSTEADSHLVCVQRDGVYQTQANSATGHPRRVTGASFVVFNGALKTSSGFLAKSSIVEDGLMVQITPETMEGLRQALRDKKDFKITCGKMDAEELKEYVEICWTDTEEKVNQGVISPVDGKSMEGIQSEKILQGGDFETEDKLMKCTEVFYILKEHELSSAMAYQFAKKIAAACSAALCPHLKMLKNNGMNKLGLRVSIDTDMVEYQLGSGGQLLPQHYLNDLDSALIPVIHGATSDPTSLPLEMELIFFLTEYLFEYK